MFGPFAIIIRDVVVDLLRFMAILVLFLTGFTFSMSCLYEDIYRPPDDWLYDQSVLMDMALDPVESFRMLYYALFGLINPGDIDLPPFGPSFAGALTRILYMIYLMGNQIEKTYNRNKGLFLLL